MNRSWLAGAVIASAGLLGMAAFAWRSARADACGALPGAASLGLREIGGLKSRFSTHGRHPDAALVLSGAEATFLLREGLGWPVTVSGSLDRLTMDGHLVHSTGCYAVHFAGSATVVGGVLYARPDELRIGDLSLTVWTSWRTWSWDLPDEGPIGALRTARVVDGRLEAWVADPVAVWESVGR